MVDDHHVAVGGSARCHVTEDQSAGHQRGDAEAAGNAGLLHQREEDGDGHEDAEHRADAADNQDELAQDADQEAEGHLDFACCVLAEDQPGQADCDSGACAGDLIQLCENRGKDHFAEEAAGKAAPCREEGVDRIQNADAAENDEGNAAEEGRNGNIPSAVNREGYNNQA